MGIDSHDCKRSGSQRRRAVRKIAVLREEVDDLRDSLDLLDARARDDGPRSSVDEVRAKLGLLPLKS